MLSTLKAFRLIKVHNSDHQSVIVFFRPPQSKRIYPVYRAISKTNLDCQPPSFQIQCQLERKEARWAIFFKPPTVGNIWAFAEYQKDVRQTGGGYSNLFTHINVHHSHVRAIKFRPNSYERDQMFSALCSSPKTQQSHDWLHFIIIGLQPFWSC